MNQPKAVPGLSFGRNSDCCACCCCGSAVFIDYALSFDDVGQLILAGMFAVVFLIVLYFEFSLAREEGQGEYAAAAPERRELREEKQRLRMQEVENKPPVECRRKSKAGAGNDSRRRSWMLMFTDDGRACRQDGGRGTGK